eukprot:CAMPEP_0171803368 /NCGR_PEP_ID=MMETSP0991-20121206/73432_1 /TAXON_ID=483369 /ORGANISM="non described non described, Strain CCMP2098" /LENGTH=334 /DNA_ID=CAMNT_0012415453 /DNA_START=87 /DNA_END=1087 /DNA_ORIENTATION=-
MEVVRGTEIQPPLRLHIESPGQERQQPIPPAEYHLAKAKMDELFVYWLTQRDTSELLRTIVTDVAEGRPVAAPPLPSVLAHCFGLGPGGAEGSPERQQRSGSRSPSSGTSSPGTGPPRSPTGRLAFSPTPLAGSGSSRQLQTSSASASPVLSPTNVSATGRLSPPRPLSPSSDEPFPMALPTSNNDRNCTLHQTLVFGDNSVVGTNTPTPEQPETSATRVAETTINAQVTSKDKPGSGVDLAASAGELKDGSSGGSCLTAKGVPSPQAVVKSGKASHEASNALLLPPFYVPGEGGRGRGRPLEGDALTPSVRAAIVSTWQAASSASLSSSSSSS